MVLDSTVIRGFCSLLRGAIEGAKAVGHLKLLIDEQTPQYHGQDACQGLEAVGCGQAYLDERRN
jgi:hypothetical protein